MVGDALALCSREKIPPAALCALEHAYFKEKIGHTIHGSLQSYERAPYWPLEFTVCLLAASRANPVTLLAYRASRGWVME